MSNLVIHPGNHGMNKDNQVPQSENHISSSYKSGDPKIGECNYCYTFSIKTKGLNGRYKKEPSHTQLWDSGRYSQDEDIYQDGSSETTSNNGSKRKPSFYYFL